MKKIIAIIVLSYLRFFARLALHIKRPVIIGIAGSVGKSSTKEALFAILKDYFSTRYTYGNSETGVPLGILGIDPGNFHWTSWLRILLLAPFKIFALKKVDYLIVEMGTDDPFPPKNMEYLLTIVKPDIAVFLNTSAAHTMQFEKALSPEEKKQPAEKKLDSILKKMAEEDGKIITQSGCQSAIYCTDNPYVRNEIERFRQKKPKSSTGKDIDFETFGENHDKGKHLHYGKYEVSIEETTFELIIEKEKISLTFPHYVLPLEYREVFGAASLIALKTGLTPHQIQNSLSKNFTIPKGRASIFHGIRNFIIIDSTYNASRPAVEAFLTLAEQLKKQTGRSLAFAFGDMRELGEEAEQEHQKVAEKIAATVDYLYCTGPLTQKHIIATFTSQEAPKNFLQDFQWFENSKALGEFLQTHLPDSAIILFKGSQNEIFLEEAIKPLLLNAADKKNLCRQENFWIK